MVFVPAANTARVAVKQTLHGQVVNNIFHFRKSGGWDSAALTALAQAVQQAWNDNIASTQSTDVQYVSVEARDMSVAGGPGVDIAFPPLSGGDVVNPALPGNVALSISWRTGLTGRSHRGRTYLAGTSEDSAVGNQATDGHVANVLDKANQFLSELNALGYEMVVASYFSGVDGNGKPIPRAQAVLTPVANALVEKWLDSQRKRLQGRGR